MDDQNKTVPPAPPVSVNPRIATVIFIFGILMAAGFYYFMRLTPLVNEPIVVKTLDFPDIPSYTQGGSTTYEIKNNTVFYNGSAIIDPDVASFHSLKNGWATDKNSVYLRGVKFAEFDAGTFEVLSDSYVRDRDHVVFISDSDFSTTMYESLKILPGESDGLFFQTIGNYGIGHEGVYYYGRKIEGADPTTFMLLSEHFFKDKNNIYYYESRVKSGPIDLSSVEVVEEGRVLKDKNGVYDLQYFDSSGTYISNPTYTFVSGVKPNGLSYVGGCASIEKSSASYLKNREKVYLYGDKMIETDIDVSSFQYFRDFEVESLGGGMPNSSSYSKDKNNIYKDCGEILEGADPLTFKVISQTGYARDAKFIWYAGRLLSNVDIPSFTSLSDETSYAKDKNRVYFAGIPIEGVDYNTFEIVKGERKNSSGYFYSQIYAKDKNRVYFSGAEEKGADPTSCTVDHIELCEAHY